MKLRLKIFQGQQKRSILIWCTKQKRPKWHYTFCIRHEIYWPSEQIFASWEELCFMELVPYERNKNGER